MPNSIQKLTVAIIERNFQPAVSNATTAKNQSEFNTVFVQMCN